MTAMLRAIAAFSAFPFATVAVAQPADVAALQQRALADETAYEITEGLTTEVGPRQAGTEQEKRARDWSVAKLNAMGFANVRNEPFTMPTWVRGAETAEVVSPFPQPFHITALGNSGSTGADGITADVVFFRSLSELVAAPDESLAGKIAFVTHNMHRTQDGSGYGAFGPVRWVGPDIAARKGAAGYVIKSIGTDYHRNPHTGNTNFSEGVTPIPAGALSLPDADNLERMVERAKARGVPVRLKLTLTPRNLGLQQSGNVIAEVLGRDPSLPMVLVACHLDSWDLSTGAFDDAAGCGIVTAAAKLVRDDAQPLRTIRILWAGAEEVGIWGGKAYAAAHADTPHALAMESDFGADRVWSVQFKLPETDEELQDELAAALLPLGIGRSSVVAGGGADIGPIIAAGNLAIIDLQQDGTRYFDLHHTPDDTLDKIDPAQLKQNVAAWTTVLSIVANHQGDLTLPPADTRAP